MSFLIIFSEHVKQEYMKRSFTICEHVHIWHVNRTHSTTAYTISLEEYVKIPFQLVKGSKNTYSILDFLEVIGLPHFCSLHYLTEREGSFQIRLELNNA